MTTIPELSATLQTLQTVRRLPWQTIGLIRRQREMTGAGFVQAWCWAVWPSPTRPPSHYTSTPVKPACGSAL